MDLWGLGQAVGTGHSGLGFLNSAPWRSRRDSKASCGSICLAILMGLLALTSAEVSAEAIHVALDFEQPVLRDVGLAGVAVEAPDCVTFNDPGLPLLPARGAMILLPPGESPTAVHVRPVGEHAIAGTYRVVSAETPRPISLSGPYPATPPDANVYGSDAAYPSEAARLVTVQTAWGHRLAFLRVYPVVYHPLSGELVWYERIEVDIESAPDGGQVPTSVPGLRHSARATEYLQGRVLNPEFLSRYEGVSAARPAWSRLDPDYFPYVIVTTEPFAAAFEELATYEASRGLRACVVQLSQISADYPGIDLAEQLRNFIIDAYQQWQTDFVMLGGDNGVVPVRNLYVDAGGTIDQFPGDCYYEGLDGNWNTDGDELWGETDEWDLAGEVAVGRASIDNLTELQNWLHKNAMYAEHPVVAEVEKALFLGEQLDDITYGDDYMDDVKDYTCAHGYCTSGYPDSYVKETLYDRGHAWDKWQAITLFNSGFPSSHHLGHSNTTYNMRMSSGDVQYFTNDGVTHSFMFVSTQGCYANNFDSNAPDAISETFLVDEHAAAAFLGSTRYGWYVIGSTGGPSQHYDRQFVDACYAEDCTQIGWANVDSKVDNIWMMNPWMQWCHYEICLLGDPAMPQWRHVEGELALAHAGGFVMGQEDYPVTVSAGETPVAGAVVTVYSPDRSVWASGLTGPDGTVTVHPNPSAPMTLYVKAVKADYLPAADSLAVAPETGPWVVLDAVTLDDDATPPSIGDGDGLADAGESLQFVLGLYNVGVDPAENVILQLSSDDPRVTLSDPTASYGVIAPGATGNNLDDLVVLVARDAQDKSEVRFSMTVTCDGRPQWTESFVIVLHAPILSVASWEIDDTASGDGQGDMDPGESFALRVTLANAGSAEGHDLQAVLACDSSWVGIAGPQSSCPLIPGEGTADLTPPFAVALDVLTPTDLTMTFDLQVTDWTGQTMQMDIRIPVASFYEDDYENDAGWRVGSANDDATAGIWVRVDPVGTYIGSNPVQPEDDHSPLGAVCFVTGQGSPGSPAIQSDVDGGRTTLRSPRIDLTGAQTPRLVYWRWFTNSQGSYPGEDYWRVDVSDDGGQNWVRLEYTNHGLNQWQRVEFLLEDYIELSDNVVIRFIADDRNHDSLVEAAVDDVAIEELPGASPVSDGPQPALSFGIHRVWPNPLSASQADPGARPGLTVSFALLERDMARLQVFDIRGALIRTLVDGVREGGEQRTAWDGRGPAGVPVGSGVYFVRLQSGGQESTARAVVIR